MQAWGASSAPDMKETFIDLGSDRSARGVFISIYQETKSTLSPSVYSSTVPPFKDLLKPATELVRQTNSSTTALAHSVCYHGNPRRLK